MTTDVIATIEDFIFDNYGVRIIIDRKASYMLRKDYATHMIHLKFSEYIDSNKNIGSLITDFINELLLHPNLITITCVDGYGERITDMSVRIGDVRSTYREK